MEFRLFYRGPLKSNGTPAEKQAIRRQFHPQIKQLWKQEPLLGFEAYLSEQSEREHLVYPLSNFNFACLVSERHKTFAELDILFLRPQPPGAIIKTGSGDIDNRLKTLFDGLRRPISDNEIVRGDLPKSDESPFHCLLSDDALITRVNITTDQLLDTSASQLHDDVVLVIHVRIKSRNTTWDSMGFF